MEKNIKFETAFAELETIVNKLEDSKTSLDEALKLYEKGIGLARICSERLDSAEQKVKILQQQKDGQIKEETINE